MNSNCTPECCLSSPAFPAGTQPGPNTSFSTSAVSSIGRVPETKTMSFF
ncbi:rCG27758 [Rattus norvegicus]|uniref:RCG27758 n=1 Tax=Rattus norvegicus TaxID=10116 RepID=A6KBN7_RAT|nr:rCG27758 [Rattus norvegicus]